jgi:hypothetical protein
MALAVALVAGLAVQAVPAGTAAAVAIAAVAASAVTGTRAVRALIAGLAVDRVVPAAAVLAMLEWVVVLAASEADIAVGRPVAVAPMTEDGTVAANAAAPGGTSAVPRVLTAVVTPAGEPGVASTGNPAIPDAGHLAGRGQVPSVAEAVAAR